MRLVTYSAPGTPTPGILTADGVYDLGDLLQLAGLDPSTAHSTRSFLEHHGDRLRQVGPQLLAQTSNTRPVGTNGGLTLGPPVPDPGKVLCIGLNYSDHVGETGRAVPTYPDVFAKFASSLLGPYDTIGCSQVSPNLDFEGELAVVIGKPARRVSEADALSYIAGLTVLNDVTARDLQYRGTQWLAGKAVDRSTPFGPAIVTLDEVADPQALKLRTVVNGTEVQSSNTSKMIFPIARIIAYLTEFLSLAPGDVIATGTPEGVGAKRQPPQWLAPGDTVEVEIENVGVLTNSVS